MPNVVTFPGGGANEGMVDSLNENHDGMTDGKVAT